MSIYISAGSRPAFHDSVFFDFTFGEMGRKVHELELQKMVEPDPDKDPEKPPPKEHGDKYLFIGTFIGLAVGGILGIVLSRFIGWFLVDIFIGLVIGGLLGVMAGSLIKKRVLSKESTTNYTDKQDYIQSK